jgi:6-pyruvoyltetrahydropterin/6-carboxytetrahydropterin synthase
MTPRYAKDEGPSMGGDRAELERSVTFRASHRYRRPERSEAEDRATFGDLVDSHPHDYRLTVRVAGPMDPRTGFVTDLPALDRALEAVVGPLRDGDLNALVFPEGEHLPSCEALARWFHRELKDRIPPPGILVQVRLAESEDLAALFPAE